MAETNPLEWTPYLSLIFVAGLTVLMAWRRDWLFTAGGAGLAILQSTQLFAPTVLPLVVKWPLLVGSVGLALWAAVRSWIRNDPRATTKPPAAPR